MSSAAPDPNPADNLATAATTVDGQADLRITKSGTPDPVVAGENVTYTVIVTNDGPSDATNVNVTDTLPVRVTLVSAVPSSGSCAPVPNFVSCNLGTVPAGATRVVTIVVTAPSDPLGATTLTNTATVSSSTPDPAPANNAVTIATGMVRRTDLSITKAAAPSSAVAGESIHYTVTVQNTGPSAEYAVIAEDALPPGLTFLGVTSTQGSCSYATGVVTCNLGTFAAGNVASIGIDVAVPSGYVGSSLFNSASVGPTALDTNLANNLTMLDTPVLRRSDLELTKTDGPDPVIAGAPLTYALTVTNHGPSDATNVIVSDTLPAGVSIIAAPGCSISFPATVTCGVGTIPTGRPRREHHRARRLRSRDRHRCREPSIRVQRGAGSEPGQQLRVREHDRDARADLQLTKIDDHDPVVAGTALTYTLHVRNAGPSDASAVSITDTLPPFVTFVGASSGCTEATGVVTCSVATLDAYADASFAVTVEVAAAVPAGATLENHAVVTANELDPNGPNNAADASTTVEREADLWITKTSTPDPVVAGETLTYDLSVTNNGPSNAADVTISDTLPAGTAFLSASAACGEAAGTVTCNFGEIALDATMFASITVTVDPSVAGGSTITNTAAAGSPDPDPNLPNNVGSATSTVETHADLELTKTASPNPAVGGQRVTYTLDVVNHGPSVARGPGERHTPGRHDDRQRDSDAGNVPGAGCIHLVRSRRSRHRSYCVRRGRRGCRCGRARSARQHRIGVVGHGRSRCVQRHGNGVRRRDRRGGPRDQQAHRA